MSTATKERGMSAYDLDFEQEQRRAAKERRQYMNAGNVWARKKARKPTLRCCACGESYARDTMMCAGKKNYCHPCSPDGSRGRGAK